MRPLRSLWTILNEALSVLATDFAGLIADRRSLDTARSTA